MMSCLQPCCPSICAPHGPLPLPADKKGGIGLWHVNEGSWELPAAARRAQPILRRPAPDDTAAAEEGEGAKPAAVSGAAVSVDSAGGEVAGGEDADAAAAFDGVLALQPQHYQYVSGLRWAGGSGRGASLFTCAYDGSLRRLDVERGVSGESAGSAERAHGLVLGGAVDGS